MAKASAAKRKHCPPEMGLLHSNQILQAMFKYKTPLLPMTALQINANTLEQRAKAAGQKAQRADCTGKHNSGYEMISTSLATAKLKRFCSQTSCRTMTQSTFFTQHSIKKPVWGHPVHITNKAPAHPNKATAASPTVMDTLRDEKTHNIHKDSGKT